MGYGEWVGNQSVHWTVACDGGHEAKGRDPVKLADVGAKGGHPGCYKVTLRFPSLKDVPESMRASAAFEKGQAVVVIHVPCVARKHPSDPPAPEIRIDW